MKIDGKKLIALFCIIISITLFKTGFVVFSAANPVSLSLADNEQMYELSIFLREDVKMNSFQFRLEYNKSHIQICETDFDEQFIAIYNSNTNALLRNGIKDGSPKSSIVFLGVQTDDKAALQKSGTVIATVKFSVDLTDSGDIVKELDSIILNVEVLEGSDGNIVDGSEIWRVSAVRMDDNEFNGRDYVDEDDLREDKAYGDNNFLNDFVSENAEKAETSVPLQTDDNGISSSIVSDNTNNSENYVSGNSVADKKKYGTASDESLTDNSLSDKNAGSIVSDTAENVIKNSTDVSKNVDKADKKQEKRSYYIITLICMFVVLGGVTEGIYLIRKIRKDKQQ